MGMLVGVDVGGTHLRVARGDVHGALQGDILARPTPHNYPTLLATIDDMITELGVPVDRLDGLGIGIPGTVGPDGPMFVPALPWLDAAEMRGDLAARYATPIAFANDAQCALLGEVAKGAARGTRDAILIALGTGVGGAILANGRLLRGATGAAGAFGWLAEPSGAAVPDSRHGPWEQVASGSALTSLARETGCSVAELTDRARAGDNPAAKALEHYGRVLGQGIAGLVSALDPAILIIAGGVSDAFDLLAPMIRREISLWASPQGRNVPVRSAELGKSAGVVGALMVARAGKHGDG